MWFLTIIGSITEIAEVINPVFQTIALNLSIAISIISIYKIYKNDNNKKNI